MAWQNNQWAPGNGYQPAYTPMANLYGQRPQQTNMDWIRVPNLGDIDQVTVQPGQTAWVMAQNTNVFAVRSADQMGIINTRYFQFSEFDPRQSDQQKQADIEHRLSRLEAIVGGADAEELTGRYLAAQTAGPQ